MYFVQTYCTATREWVTQGTFYSYTHALAARASWVRMGFLAHVGVANW